MPEFDPQVTTHVITDANVLPTLRALGMRGLKDIPDHIPTVRWSWILSVLGKESLLSKDEIERKLGDTWLHAAFSKRMDAGYQPQKTASLTSWRDKSRLKMVDEVGLTRKLQNSISPSNRHTHRLQVSKHRQSLLWNNMWNKTLPLLQRWEVLSIFQGRLLHFSQLKLQQAKMIRFATTLRHNSRTMEYVLYTDENSLAHPFSVVEPKQP